MIRLEAINKTYRAGSRTVHALRDVAVTITGGELVAVMGASGSGKSTLLNVLGLLDTPDSGAYYLDGERVSEKDPHRAALLRNRRIGFVFQSFNLLPFKTAIENVALPLYYQGVKKRERLESAARMLEQLGLREWAEHRPQELSGGQQQRVAIARALVTQPKLVLADEPTGALDSRTSAQVMDLLQDVNRTGMTVIIVTHEREIAERTHRIVRLRDGQIES